MHPSNAAEPSGANHHGKRPFDPSTLFSPPFASKDISPPTTEEQNLRLMQQFMNAMSLEANMPAPSVHLANTPVAFDSQTWRMNVQSLDQSSSGAQAPVSIEPLSGAPRLTDSKQVIDLQLLEDRPIQSVETLLSRASMYLVDPSNQSDGESQRQQAVRAAAATNPFTRAQIQPPIPNTDTWEHSEEAVTAFPTILSSEVGLGRMAGMANPGAKAEQRLSQIEKAMFTRYVTNLIELEILSGTDQQAAFLRAAEEAPAALTRIRAGERLEPFVPNEFLCTRCRSLKLTPEAFIPRGPHADQIPREGMIEIIDFPFETLKLNWSCPLCRLMRHGLESTAPNFSVTDLDLMHCTLYLAQFSFYWDNHSKFESFRFLYVSAKETSGEGKQVTTQLLPVETKQYPLGFIGRQLQQDRVSPTLIRRWLQQCEQIHGPMCTNMNYNHRIDAKDTKPKPNQLNDLLKVLHFIDVQNSCLTTVSSPVRYLALSYVWRKTKFSHTMKANLPDRIRPGALSTIAQELPAVILDAITLTRDIGERYLWIDSLCIVQDDNTSKTQTINKMNVVYENAVLTLIAASGNNADDGLPGVRPGSRTEVQQVATVGTDLKFIVPHNLQGLDDSTWATRAWT
jgi:hypothetical protein